MSARGTPPALDAHVVVGPLDGFDLDVVLSAQPGEVVAVMGPSGAGKSTLLHALVGLAELRAGHVRINGRTVADAAEGHSRRPEHRATVLLGQQPRLFPHLTAAENVAFGMRAHGVSRRDARAGAERWLERVGLPAAGGRRPSDLSGGQQQRVAIARALATEPELLLLDEPLTGLDPRTEAEVRGVLGEQLEATGVTAVLVTHDALDAAALASALVVLESGRVTQAGTTLDVLREPATEFVAAAAGLNRLDGRVDSRTWRSATGGLEIAGVDVGPGPAAVAFRPADVRLEPSAAATASATTAPAASTMAPTSTGTAQGRRLTWEAEVVRLERQPDGVRVHTAEPPVAVDVGADVVAALRLTPGAVVRLDADAAAVRIFPPRPAP